MRAKLADASGDNRARVLPHAEAIRSYVGKLRAVMDRDDEGATPATLLRYMPPVVITPLPERAWKLTGAFGLSLQLSDAPGAPESLGKRAKLYEPRE